MRSLSPAAAGLLLVAGAAAGLGSLTTIARLAYEGGMNPATIVAARLWASGAFFGVWVFLRRGGRRDFARIAAGLFADRRRFLPLAGFAASIALTSVFYLSSVVYIPVGLAAILFYTNPLMVAAASAMIDKSAPSRMAAAMFILAFLGLGLALAPGRAALDVRGALLALAAAASFAAGLFFGTRAARRMPPLQTALWVNVVGGMLMLPWLFAAGFEPPQTTAGVLAFAASLLIFGLSMMLHIFALERVSAARAALVYNIEPLVSIMMAWLILGEVLTWMQGAGAALVIFAIVAVARFDKPRPAPPLVEH